MAQHREAPPAPPSKLASESIWLVYKLELRAHESKPRKVPYYTNGKRRSGRQGDERDRAQLVTFAEAARVFQGGQEGYDGLGHVFLPADGRVGIDLDGVIDPDTGEISERALKIVAACASYTEYSPSRKGVHILVEGAVDRSFKSNEAGVEVYCGTQFFTYTGAHFPGTPTTINPISDVVIGRLRATVDQAKGRARQTAVATGAAVEVSGRAKVESALAFVSADCGYAEWIEVLMAIHAELGPGAFDVADSWSAKSAKYPGRRQIETHWKSFESGRGITGATLYKLAGNAGWRARGLRKRDHGGNSGREGATSAGADGPDYQAWLDEVCGSEVPASLWSEDAMAKRFSEHFGDGWRYVAVWARWYAWRGCVWVHDDTLEHFDLARRVCRSFAQDVRSSSHKNAERIALAIESARSVAAVVRLAGPDRRHASTVSQWDRHLMELNTPLGIVDLTTGELHPHARDAYCTKITAAGPDRRVRPRTWFRFLHRVTGGDRRLIAYLQRLAGYALTGNTQEQCFAFLYGLGANGKSTFLNTLIGLMGNYAQTASADVFLDSHNDRHPTDVAAMRGARLVVAQEIEEGRRWAVARLKQFTGGEDIRARFMRQDEFEYTPTFKLLFAGNHKPSLRNVDEGIRRRVHLVPFTQTIPAAERDPKLMAKLREEWPGIMAWAVRGSLRWQRLRLRPPRVVRGATEDYLQGQDVLEAWMKECTVREANAFTPSTQLHASHHAWAERYDERFYSISDFLRLLEERGFERWKKEHANGMRGLRLTATDQQFGLK